MTEDQIYERIFSAILEQRLLPNKKINEEELASIFGVSRTIIRKVLLRLSLDGAISLQKNRGAYVSALSSDQVHRLYSARRIVERGIVAIACQVAGEKDIERLKEVIASEHECHVRGDRSGRIRLSGEFHLEIARIADNELLYGFLRRLVIQTSLSRACYEENGVAPCNSPDHELLVEAIASGDAQLAKELVVKHLKMSESELNLTASAPKDDLKSIFV